MREAGGNAVAMVPPVRILARRPVSATASISGDKIEEAIPKSKRALIGMTGLASVSETLPVAPAVEIEWRFVPQAWRQGYASEAARAALDWAFANLDRDKILAFTADTNLASQGVMRKIGMVADPSRDFDHPNLAADHPLNRHVVYAARK